MKIVKILLLVVIFVGSGISLYLLSEITKSVGEARCEIRRQYVADQCFSMILQYDREIKQQMEQEQAYHQARLVAEEKRLTLPP